MGPAQAAAEGRADLKRQLLWRMGLAGLMILALLGVLALFDYANAPDDWQTGQQFTEPVPVRKREPVQALTAAETPLASPVEEPPAASEQAAASEAASEVASDPGAESSPAKKTDAGSIQARAPKAAAAAGDSALPVPPPPPRVAATPALPPPATRPTASSAIAATPPPSVVEPPPTVAVRLVSGYIVQSGLFSDLALAEEWQARLAQEGIPATLEARLQIGPFKNRAEAEAARRQLKRLGIDAPSTVRKVGKP
ncbi:MAG TPA: SPOR domain-containing protein [Accumulibacter sp.]|nr:SPOR domain-containing protein [Accumulibacter sp.]